MTDSVHCRTQFKLVKSWNLHKPWSGVCISPRLPILNQGRSGWRRKGDGSRDRCTLYIPCSPPPNILAWGENVSKLLQIFGKNASCRQNHLFYKFFEFLNCMLRIHEYKETEREEDIGNSSMSNVECMQRQAGRTEVAFHDAFISPYIH